MKSHVVHCAGLSEALETSDFTNVQAQITDRRSVPHEAMTEDQGLVEHGEKARWLSPVTLKPPRK